MSGNIYDELLACCGLAPLLAADVIARACAREGVNAQTMTRGELVTALPAIEKGLKLYLGPTALKLSLQRLRALAVPSHGADH